MDGEAGWWTTSGNIGLPPLARVMGVGRQQQAGKTHFFRRDPISNKGDKGEIIGDGTDTADLVLRAIKSCRNSKAFGPEKLSVFHLKHLGPRSIEYITALLLLTTNLRASVKGSDNPALPGVLSTWLAEAPPSRETSRGPVCCLRYIIQIQNPFLTAQSTQIKSVISVPIKDFIHHYPRAFFNDIPRVGAALLRHTRVEAHFYDIPGSGRTFYDIPGSGRSLTTYPGH